MFIFALFLKVLFIFVLLFRVGVFVLFLRIGLFIFVLFLNLKGIFGVCSIFSPIDMNLLILVFTYHMLNCCDMNSKQTNKNLQF